MKLTLLGTGNAGMLPVYGCHCIACRRAIEKPHYRRQKTSAVIESNGKQLLIDANCDHFLTRFPANTIDRILLTHYHMDHVHALFDLRWGVGKSIPVDGPPDKLGCDDLFKHPGLLDFQPALTAFKPFYWQGIEITPLPMQHSKPCFGYCFKYQDENNTIKKLAYLTDTIGLPEGTLDWLQTNRVDTLLIDCNHSPEYQDPNRNHNNLNDVKKIINDISPKQTHLIHISHELDCWLMNHSEMMDENLSFSMDGDIYC